MLYQYRMLCSTDGWVVSDWASSAPTDCPVDGGHSIDASMTVPISEKPSEDSDENKRIFDGVLGMASSTYTVISNGVTSMSVTPEEAVYRVVFDCVVEHGPGSQVVTVALFKDGSLIPGTERSSRKAANYIGTLHTQDKIYVDGSQAIEAKIKVSTKTASLINPTLTLEK